MNKAELKQIIQEEIYNALVDTFEHKLLTEGVATSIADMIFKIIEKNRIQSLMNRAQNIDPEIARQVNNFKIASKSLKDYLEQDYGRGSSPKDKAELISVLRNINKK